VETVWSAAAKEESAVCGAVSLSHRRRLAAQGLERAQSASSPRRPFAGVASAPRAKGTHGVSLGLGGEKPLKITLLTGGVLSGKGERSAIKREDT
jgi:hypothetical protein